MATPKSPFYIVRNFLSPHQCEQIVYSLGFYTPDVDPNDKPLKMMRHDEESELLVFNKFEPLIPLIEKYYSGYDHQGTEGISFEYFPDQCETEPLCENSNWVRKKWVMTKPRDLSCLLFLSDYNDKGGFDSDYEVYGGKLGFHNFNFSFNPERGTLIVYPSGPHFINSTSKIQYGALFQARWHLASKLPFLYFPDQFPGGDDPTRNWFKGLT